jgi:hypothetical protein
MDETITVAFTLDELHEIEQALYERLYESKRYADSNRQGVGQHDTCCETARVRKAMRAEMQTSLDDRVTHVASAIEKVVPLCTKEHKRHGDEDDD